MSQFSTTIELLVMKLLRVQPDSYGLELIRASNNKLKRGTIYVTLMRLEKRGLVSRKVTQTASHPGLPRPRYCLTRSGEKMLADWDKPNPWMTEK